MTQQILNPNSSAPNDKLGDTPWDYTQKINSNFTELYGLIPLNVKVINKESDFPAPVSGVINLEDDYLYIIGSTIVTANRFNCGQNNKITTNNPFSPALVYTGSGYMFTADNVNFAMDSIVISCPSASFVNADSSSSASTVGFNLVTVVQCQTFLTLNDLRSLNLTNCRVVDANQGVALSGTNNWEVLSISRLNISSTSSSFVAVDLGSSLLKNTEILNLFPTGVSGSVGIKGFSNSGNITTGFVASINQSEFISPLSPIDGITSDDIRFSFLGNSGLEDSTVDANPRLTTSTTVPISSSGTYVKINQGNWAATEQSRLSVSSDGDITNLLESPVKIQINGSITLEKVGGGSDLITARLVYNNNPGDSQSVVTEMGTDNNNPSNIGLVGIFTLQPGDSVSMYVANQDSSSDVIVDYAKFAMLRVL